MHPARTVARRARLSLTRWRLLPFSREPYLSLAGWRLRANYVFGQGLMYCRLLAYYRGRYLLARRPGAPAVCFGTPDGTEKPHFIYVIWKVCHLLGFPIRPLAAARPGDIRWAWNVATTNDPVPGAINGECTDTSKSRVDAAMRQVFGYGAEIDPTTHEGVCVRKSEENGVHDGRIVKCPHEPEPGYVYQRLIDTQVGDELEELRVVKVGSKVPFVYRWRRDLANRFRGTKSAVAIDPATVFTDEELARVVATSEVIGLDVGELDVLRDTVDGRIYVIDINKTPSGPHRAMSWAAGRRAMWMVAEACRKYLAVTPVSEERGATRASTRRGAADRSRSVP